MSDEIHCASTNDPVGSKDAQKDPDRLIEAPDAVSPKPITINSPPATALRYEIDTKYGQLVCDYYPSVATSNRSDAAAMDSVINDFKRRFGTDFLTIEKVVPQINDDQSGLLVEMETTEQLCVNQFASAAWLEFTHGLGGWLGNAVIQFFELCIFAARIQNRPFNDGRVGTLKNGTHLVSNLVKQQAEAWLQSPHVSWKPLMNLPFRYYVDSLPIWKDAKSIYSQNKQRLRWREMIKAAYPQLPLDLVEWLAPQEILGADAFPNLSMAIRTRLSKRLAEGYSLRHASDIALEHAARLCGYPEYEYSISHLKASKAQYYELAVSMGLEHYLKNARRPSPNENKEKRLRS